MCDISIIPKPQSVELTEGCFSLTTQTSIQVDANDVGMSANADYLKECLGGGNSVSSEAVENSICLELDDSLAAGEYRFDVLKSGIRIAGSGAGVFYGIQSLRQLLSPETILNGLVPGQTYDVPCLSIQDKPRFGWRGMHLDVARHFMPMTFMKKFIDLLALHKLNVLHWHLTEDQGWRIEIKKYPKLTEIGSKRKHTLVGHLSDYDNEAAHVYDGKPHEGFYTQDEVREIVEYARQRYVTVVPEIDMPGHMQAAIAAYPELGCVDEQLEPRCYWGICKNVLNPEQSTVDFMKDVLEEVLDLFPSEFIHIGGDEVPKDQWEASDRIQALREERGLKDMHEMQSWFIRQLDDFLQEKGRRLIGWDEILEGGLASGATVMSWRGEKGAIEAAKAGHDFVMASNSATYFDHYQGEKAAEPLAIGGDLPLAKVYAFEPIPPEMTEPEAKHALGMQAQLWTEYMQTPEHVEYMAFPRECALAELAWLQPEKKDYEDFLKRLATHLKRLDQMKVNYRKLD